MLAGKLAAEVVAERAAGVKSSREVKPIVSSILDKVYTPREPLGMGAGNSAITFGGGEVLGLEGKKALETFDADQLI